MFQTINIGAIMETELTTAILETGESGEGYQTRWMPHFNGGMARHTFSQGTTITDMMIRYLM